MNKNFPSFLIISKLNRTKKNTMKLKWTYSSLDMPVCTAPCKENLYFSWKIVTSYLSFIFLQNVLIQKYFMYRIRETETNEIQLSKYIPLRENNNKCLVTILFAFGNCFRWILSIKASHGYLFCLLPCIFYKS